MKKVQLLLRKLIKAILWGIITLVLLLVVIALLIQIPAIQNKIIHGVTDYISNKTHSKIELKNIGISFPKSVVIEGLYLEDLKKDTLLYAGKTKVNIALYELFHHKISISSIALEEVSLRLNSSKTDSLFNYNFLLTAFGDTTKQANANLKTASKWTFSIDQVSLKSARFRYDDAYAGINVFAVLKNSEFGVDKIDPQNSLYSVVDLLAEGVTANVLVTASINTQQNQSGSVLPTIAAQNLQLNNAVISFIDSVGNQSIVSDIDRCKLENASIDIQKQLLASDYIYLSKSKIQFHTFGSELSANGTALVPIAATANNWKVSVKSMVLDDNSLTYKAGNNPEIRNTFNPDRMEYNHLMLEATDLLYSPDLTKVSVKKFSAIDQNNFAITSFETDFSMDQHSIIAKKLKANTTNSSIDADLRLKYSSLSTLMDSLQFSNLDLDLRHLRFKNADVLYFKPDLTAQSFFKNSQNVTTASGTISGRMNNLIAKNLSVKTGVNTMLKTDFVIKGLPEYQTAFYDFPNLRMTSGKKDIEMLVGPSIPVSIELPENISMQAVFKGKLKSFESTANMTSSFGAANLIASIDPSDNFSSKMSLSNFDLGRLLKDTILYGPVSLTSEANGQGLDLKTVKAKIKAEVTQIYLNKYTYHDLKLDGTLTGKEFEGKISLNDENAVFDFDGLVNLNPNSERYNFRLNVKGADLQKLRLTKNDARIAFVASADLKGGTADKMNGTATITNIIVASNGKKYVLDSFLAASVNEPDKNEVNVSSALIGIKYTGTVFPTSLPAVLSRFINHYFPFTDSKPQLTESDPSGFSFRIQLHNHPILSEVILPQLKEFEPGIIQGSFDSRKNELKLNATVNKIVYGTTEINDFAVDVISDNTALNYKISSSAISNSQIKLDNFSLDGKLADGKIFANISSTNDKNKKLLIRSQLTKEHTNYKLTLDPKEFYLVNNRWNIAADNSIEFGKQGLKIHHLFLNHAESQINIASVHDQFNDDLNIAIKNFRMGDISRIVEKDSSLVKGNVDGNILLKRVNNTYGLIADATISNLVVHETPIGNLAVKADNPTADKFNIEVKLVGPDNNLTANGYFIPNGGDHSIGIQTDIQSLSLKTVEAFSMGQLKEASGTLTGNLLVEGSATAPDVTGELVFNNAFIKPAFLNNRLELKHETIQLKKEGIY